MSFSIGFVFKNKNDENVYKSKTDENDPSLELYSSGGWDRYDLASYIKDLGDEIITETDDPYFPIKDYIMPVSALKEFADIWDAIQKHGVDKILDDCPDDIDLDTYYYDEILGYKYSEKASELLDDLNKYDQMDNPDNAKAVRLADLEYADSLKDKQHSKEKEFKKQLTKALDEVDIHFNLKDYIIYHMPYSLWDIENISNMYHNLKKIMGENCKLNFYAS